MVNYSTLLCFDSMLTYNTSVQNNIVMTSAKQNQKFPFHFFFRFAVEGWGEETRGKCKEIFGFCTRESASVSEAHCIASPRNRSVRRGLEPPRAPRVRLVVKILRILPEIHSNFVQYTPPKLEIGIRSRNGVGAKRRHKRIPAKNSRIQKVFPRSAWLKKKATGNRLP